jgi:hypothetical protein
MAALARTHRRSAECVANVATQLLAWPDLAVKRTRKKIGFHAKGREIVRMPGDHTAELLLTTPLINRWERQLADSQRVTPAEHPGWIVVEIEDHRDEELFLSLVSVAIKANQDLP